MNLEYFIAKRLIATKAYKSSVSGPIIKIGILAIAIGVIVMLIAISTGKGLQNKIRDKVIAFNGHATLANFDNNASNESQFPIDVNQNFSDDYKHIDAIAYQQGVASKFGIVRTETDFDGILYKGVGTDYNWTFFKDFLTEGRLPLYSDKTSNEVLISTKIAARLNLKVGDQFEMLFLRANKKNPLPRQVKLSVVGLYNSGFQDLDKVYLIGDIKHLQRINKWKSNEVGEIEIFFKNHNDIEAKSNLIYINTPSNLKTESVLQRYRNIFEFIKIFDQNIYGIIIIMIIVAGINMITALLVLILERTPMIGIIKALGGSNWMLRKVFLYNASYLIGLGLFWGNIIGLSVLFIQKYFKLIPLNPDTYYVSEVQVYLSLDFILLLNLGTFVMCLIMLLIPSYVITKMSPVKAIRFD